MKIILVRHAIAEEKVVMCGKVIADDQRKLTPEGLKKQGKANRFLKKKIKKIDTIFTSPLVRATQTAELIGKEFVTAPVIETDHLLPNSKVEHTLAWLKKNASKMKCVVLVGHEPHLSAFASDLLAGQQGVFVRMKKSGIAVINIEDLKVFESGEAELYALYSPGPL